MARFFGLAAFLTVASFAGSPQSEKLPAFEVASIKPHVIPEGGFFVPTRTMPRFRISGNRVSEPFVKIQQVIMDAYDVMDYQVTGGPKWAQLPGPDDFYDIEAKAEGEGKPSPDQVRLMLQTLLVDRFHLSFHKEVRELSVYELTVDRGGPKIHNVAPKVSDLKSALTGPSSTDFRFLRSLIAQFADRPVFDKTGLTGLYEYNVPWPHIIDMKRPEIDTKNRTETLFEAVQHYLGLRLEQAKDSVDVMVVDRLERPTAP